MTGSPSSIVMLGFGNGTFAGSPSLVVTLGFGTGFDVSALHGLEYSLTRACPHYTQTGQPQYDVIGRTQYIPTAED